jgi:hypothetical protein
MSRAPGSETLPDSASQREALAVLAVLYHHRAELVQRQADSPNPSLPGRYPGLPGISASILLTAQDDDAGKPAMFVTFTCPQCQKLVAVLQSSIGRREACPNCRAELFIPRPTRRTAVPQTQMEGHAVQAQGGGPPLVELPSDEWEFGDIGFHADEHSYAYFVLTRDFFGWFPSIMPMNVRFFYPRKYYVIPIESITFAEIRPGGMHPSWRLFLHLEPESDEHVVEVGIGLPGRWRRALRTCKVPVIESGAYRVDSLPGG